jgi:hypothetical protein
MQKRWHSAAAIILLSALPALAGDCPGEFKAAEVPGLLPPLGENACPISHNVGTGARPVQQDFIIRDTTIDDFLEYYLGALAGMGWGDPETAAMGPINSLSIRHPDGYRLQLVMNDFYMTDANMGAAKESSGDEQPLTRVKVILHRKP